MLKLIIVDDEYLLRQLIRNIIDWKALDIEVVEKWHQQIWQCGSLSL